MGFQGELYGIIIFNMVDNGYIILVNNCDNKRTYPLAIPLEMEDFPLPRLITGR